MKAVATAFATVAVLTGCTSPTDDRVEPRPSAPAASTATPTPSPTPTYRPDSLRAAFDAPVSAGDLTGRGAWVDVGPYARREVTWRSDDLTVSGVLFKPDGDGPFPAVVLNHGYIDPAVYAPGQGMPREQDLLARRGFMVLHVDYRGHASGDDVSALTHEMRVGYARDAIAAVKVLEARPDVDADRIGMFGRSMGGGVTLAALEIEPDVVDAAVVHASVSSRFVDNFRRWTVPSRSGRATALTEQIGTVEQAPERWAELSPRTYLDRIEASVLMVHGGLDDSCPIDWSRQTAEALERAGGDVELVEYPNQGHTFDVEWADAMERTIDHLEAA